jgi:hypothetical protein
VEQRRNQREETKMKAKTICLMTLFLLVLCASAHPAYWESSVTQVGTLSPGQNSDYGRLLFKFDLPEQVNGAFIDYAELRFTATPDTGSSYICLMGVFPVATSWESANLSWSSGWSNPGGDYIDTIYSSCVIRTSTDRLTRADITEIVQMWVDSTLTNNGVILMPLEDGSRFMKLHDTNGFPQGVKAKVRVFYSERQEE